MWEDSRTRLGGELTLNSVEPMSLSARQKHRIRRTRDAARELRALEQHRHNPAPLRAPKIEYWRDLSVEVGGTLISAFLIFGFGRAAGFFTHPDERSLVLRVIGVGAIVATLAFLAFRYRHYRHDRIAGHPETSNALFRALVPQVSVPMLLLGLMLALGYL